MSKTPQEEVPKDPSLNVKLQGVSNDDIMLILDEPTIKIVRNAESFFVPSRPESSIAVVFATSVTFRQDVSSLLASF